jgi:putative flavoprotein involved in K+ transport
VTALQYAAYLERYARHHRLRLQLNTKVLRVTHHPSQPEPFELTTNQGTRRAACLVNATGYAHHPHLPAIEGAQLSNLRQCHAAECLDPDQWAASLPSSPSRILIVGQRLTAGQLLLEGVDCGACVALSHRRPLRFGPGPVAWWFFVRLFPALERLRLAWPGSRFDPVDVKMPGGRPRRLLLSGAVRCFPEIARLDSDKVCFVNGDTWQPDLVIYATGYRPDLRHLEGLPLDLNPSTGLPACRGFESARVPGLYFLGLEGLHNFRSRFLRGIREDAAVLAALLQDRQTAA